MSLFNIDSKDIVSTSVQEDLNRKVFLPVSIPTDAMPNRNISPGRVLAGYNLPVTSEIAFGAYMMSQAQANPLATGVYWCTALNSGSTGGRYWFGYLFSGGPISSDDFVKAPKKSEVTGAVAFTGIVFEEKES